MKMTRHLPALLGTLLCLFCIFSTGAAAYYFIYSASTINFTAVTPDIQFYRWSDEATRNNITLTYNFAANVTTYDTNATWGIRNSGASNKTVENWIQSISNTAKVANVTIQILTQNGATIMNTTSWVTGDPAPPTALKSWTAVNGTNYMLRIWCKGATSVATITVTLGLQTTEG
jgi:hypothetical protein